MPSRERPAERQVESDQHGIVEVPPPATNSRCTTSGGSIPIASNRPKLTAVNSPPASANSPPA